MGPGQYASTGSGKLKLKGVKDSKVDKKKKKSASSNPKEKDGINVDEDVDDVFRDQSVMLKRLEEEDKVMAAEAKTAVQKRKDNGNTEPPYQLEETDTGEIVKTEAERRYEEQRRRRLEERLKREGVKTHKERVEELNRYLSSLSEHHDMPRIGPG